MKILSILCLVLSFSTFAEVKNGTMAPNFTLVNAENKQVSLADYKGKTVVLEWLNHGCPFVKKHYNTGNMQDLQKEFTKKDVVWLSVISSAPGKQGHSTPEEAKTDKSEKRSLASEILIDESGKVGRQYGAQTTPHMYVINKEGKIVYQGAIDDKPSTSESDVKDAKNYVRLALNETFAGESVKIAKTRAYGCSVKY